MKTITLICIFLFAVSCRPLSKNKEVKLSIDDATDLYLKGEFGQALLALDRIQQVDGSNYLVYEIRALVLDKTDNEGDIEPLILSNINKAIHLAPGRASASYYLRGSLALSHDDIKNALKDLSASIELDPTNPTVYQAYIRRATAYGSLSNYVAAIRDAVRAIELNPQEVQSYVICAAAYNAISNRAEATRNLDIALNLDPSNKFALIVKGEMDR